MKIPKYGKIKETDKMKGKRHEKEDYFVSGICYKFIADVNESIWRNERCARNYRHD